MPAPISGNLQKKIADRLTFYQDLGIAPFYRDRRIEHVFQQEPPLQSTESAVRPTQIPDEEPTLPKTLRKPDLQKLVASTQPKIAPLSLPAVPEPSLFDADNRIADDTLLKVRADL